MASYRHEAKTHNRYHLGASFDLGFTRIKKELEAPRPKNRFLVKFGFSVKIHLYHPKGGLHCVQELLQGPVLEVLVVRIVRALTS